jgi:predicted small lipoprotein YifL
MSSRLSGRGRLVIVAILVSLALPALSACGRKGPPEPPEGTTYPRQYPNPIYQ